MTILSPRFYAHPFQIFRPKRTFHKYQTRTNDHLYVEREKCSVGEYFPGTIGISIGHCLDCWWKITFRERRYVATESTDARRVPPLEPPRISPHVKFQN